MTINYTLRALSCAENIEDDGDLLICACKAPKARKRITREK